MPRRSAPEQPLRRAPGPHVARLGHDFVSRFSRARSIASLLRCSGEDLVRSRQSGGSKVRFHIGDQILDRLILELLIGYRR